MGPQAKGFQVIVRDVKNVQVRVKAAASLEHATEIGLGYKRDGFGVVIQDLDTNGDKYLDSGAKDPIR
jgi:hypothetical protein